MVSLGLALYSRTLLMNWSNKYAPSTGPHLASGWNCTVKKGLLVWMMPSFEPSLALTKYSLHSGGRVFISTA